MAELSMTLKIPALDRLCAILEGWENEKPVELIATRQPPLVEIPKAQTVPAAPESPKQPPKAEPVQIPTPTPEPASQPQAAPAQPAVKVDDLMRAAAALRDENGPSALQAVTAMFPEFGINKISDLKPDQYDAFAARLRAMGAKV